MVRSETIRTKGSFIYEDEPMTHNGMIWKKIYMYYAYPAVVLLPFITPRLGQ